MNVECVECGTPIYDCKAVGRDFAGAKIQAEDFEPLGPWPKPVNGEQTVCPVCGKNFFFNDQGRALLRLEGGAWWPHPPLRQSGGAPVDSA